RGFEVVRMNEIEAGESDCLLGRIAKMIRDGLALIEHAAMLVQKGKHVGGLLDESPEAAFRILKRLLGFTQAYGFRRLAVGKASFRRVIHTRRLGLNAHR